MPARPDPLNRRPWPMKWIIVGILACIIPYTWLTLAYRKEGPAHQPYQDNKDRAQVLRLLESGFNRFDLSIAVLVDPAAPIADAAPTEKLAGGLPPLLRDLLIDPPPMPSRIPRLAAPATGLAGAPYTFDFASAQPDLHERPATATLYQRDQELVVIVGYDANPGELQTCRLDATAAVTLPANTLKPGTYQITLLGALESRRWRLEIL
jgi:hypothetical protein